MSLPQKTPRSETYSLSCNRLGLPAIKVEDGDTILIVNNPSLYQKYALLLNACFIGIPNLIPRYRLIKNDPNLHS